MHYKSLSVIKEEVFSITHTFFLIKKVKQTFHKSLDVTTSLQKIQETEQVKCRL